MKPRIFISAVTAELGTTRQLVANELTRLGYDPVWEDIFGSEPGDLLQVLRDLIDSCDGLIHLVGRGYGAEPSQPDPKTGRVSYTQYEFLYAGEKWKNPKERRTWLIFVGDGCTRDTPPDRLDLPRDPAHVDPAGYQAERRGMQEVWRQRLETGAHLFHKAANDDQIRLRINELNPEFGKLWRSFRMWQKQVLGFGAAAVLLLGIVLVGQAWLNRDVGAVKQDTTKLKNITGEIQTTATDLKTTTESGLKTITEQLAALKPEDIKAQLRRTIEETYQQQLQEAEKLTAFDKRDEAKKSAAEMRERRLGQVDEFLKSITSTIQSGEASPEFLELTRVIQEEGVDRALAYIASKESRLLDEAEQLTQQKRRKLAPLLEGVRLHQTKNELEPALALCEKLLKQDGDWPDLLHLHAWIHDELGDRAMNYETVASALAHYEAAEKSARRLVALDDSNPVGQRDLSVCFNKLGGVFLKLGRTADALTQFEDGLKIRRALAEADPRDAQKQRDLSVSFERLGDVFLTLGRTADALTQFEADLKIARALAEADPRDAQKQRDLWVSFNILGDVFLKLGRTDDALTQFEDGLKIRRALAEADPRDTQKQRDLMISHYKLGQVQVQLANYEAAITRFQDGIAVLDAMIEKKLLVESAAKEKTLLEQRIQFCREKMKK